MNLEIYKTTLRRFSAGLIDGLIFLPFLYLESIFTTPETSQVVTIIGLIFYYTVSHFYSIILHGYFGQTIGKMLTKVRVANVNGESISLKQAIVRDMPYPFFSFCFLSSEINQVLTVGINEDFRGTSFDYVIIGLMCLWVTAEIIFMLSNEKRRAIHDYIAGTVVVKTNL